MSWFERKLTKFAVSGTYLPTLTNAGNVAASTAYSAQYMRVGDTVTVSGRVDIDPTAGATNSALFMSLPIASNFANANELGGSGSSLSSESLRIIADATGDRAQINLTPASAANATYSFTFTYRII